LTLKSFPRVKTNIPDIGNIVPNSNWKNAERKVAGFFGSKRRPLSGMNSRSGGRDDSQHPDLFIETKYGKQCKGLWRLYRQTSRFAKKEKKIPLVAYCEPNSEGFLLIIRSTDLARIYRAYKHAKAKP
jgi:hypothetical protein